MLVKKSLLLSFTVLASISLNTHAADTGPISMSAKIGDIDGELNGLAKKDDGKVVLLYSNQKAKLTTKFKFNTKDLRNSLVLKAALKQSTAKDVFTFYAINPNGKNIEIGKTSGSNASKTLSLPIPQSAIKKNVLQIQIISKSSDDIILDYLVIDDGGSVAVTPPVVVPPSLSSVPAGTSFHLQLQGAVKLDGDAKLYDIDLYDTTESSIAHLKAQGKIVICYFSAGSYEDWRVDAALFPKVALGNNLDGWPGEKWVDTRNAGIRKIMSDRMALAKRKGCDGVDPDNVDGYSNKPGFPLTIKDQIDYNKFLANDAHSKGLLIGLKNSTDQVTTLVDYFDFSVVEQCSQYNECARYSPFIEQNKAVFVAEYVKYSEKICDASRALNFSTTFFNLALDGKLIKPCP